MTKNKEKEKETRFETIELRGSIKDEKLQKLMQKSLERAMRKLGGNNG
jgi:hypothetical protein